MYYQFSATHQQVIFCQWYKDLSGTVRSTFRHSKICTRTMMTNGTLLRWAVCRSTLQLGESEILGNIRKKSLEWLYPELHRVYLLTRRHSVLECPYYPGMSITQGNQVVVVGMPRIMQSVVLKIVISVICT